MVLDRKKVQVAAVHETEVDHLGETALSYGLAHCMHGPFLYVQYAVGQCCPGPPWRDTVIPVAPDDLLDDMGIEDDGLYGLYQGTPLTEREWNYGNVLPDRIVIYQGPIERDAANDGEIEEIVLDTVVHEIGHYFGFDDETLYGIEVEKAERKKRRS